MRAPLSLVTVDKSLDCEVPITEHCKHEPQFTTKAVWQRATLGLPLNNCTFNHFITQGPTLCESLVLHLATLLASQVSSTSKYGTSGISRQVCHTGTFVEASGGSGETTQAKNKATVRLASAKVWIFLVQWKGIISWFLLCRNFFISESKP